MRNKFFLNALSKSGARWDGKQDFFLHGLNDTIPKTESVTPRQSKYLNKYLHISADCWHCKNREYCFSNAVEEKRPQNRSEIRTNHCQ